MTYYRIQTADRDAQDLLNPENWTSTSWGGPESYDRPGVSVCASLDELAYYLANSGIPYGDGDWVIVELGGERVEGVTPMDAAVGELLIYPTEIVGVQPMADEFFDRIAAHFDNLDA